MRFLKKVMVFVIAVLVVISAVSGTALADDTFAGFIPISTKEELNNIRNSSDGKFYLKNDIVFEAADFQSGGVFEGGFEPIGSNKLFKVHFNGNGHAIKGIRIKAGLAENAQTVYAGLFGYVSGTVENLYIIDATVVSEPARYANTGIIAGAAIGTIKNCYVSGAVNLQKVETSGKAGGIVGTLYKGDILDSVSYADVKAVGGHIDIGGIAGKIDNKATIVRCSNFGKLTADGVDASTYVNCGGIVATNGGQASSQTSVSDCLNAGGLIVSRFANVRIGGIAGQNNTKIDKCISVGAILTENILSHIYSGPIAGVSDLGTIENSYYSDEIIGLDFYCDSGTVLNDEGLKNSGSFAGFDFNNTWEIKDGYPILKSTPTIKVEDPIATLTGIIIKSLPKKTVYVQGENLNIKGLEVAAVYTDGERTLSATQYAIGGYDNTKVGTQTITVSYKGFSQTFEITVNMAPSGVIVPSVVPSKPSDSSSNENNSSNGGSSVTPNNPNGSSDNNLNNDGSTVLPNNSNGNQGITPDNSGDIGSTESSGGVPNNNYSENAGGNNAPTGSDGTSTVVDGNNSGTSSIGESVGIVPEDNGEIIIADGKDVIVDNDITAENAGETDGAGKYIAIYVIIAIVLVAAACAVIVILKKKGTQKGN